MKGITQVVYVCGGGGGWGGGAVNDTFSSIQRDMQNIIVLQDKMQFKFCC